MLNILEKVPPLHQVQRTQCALALSTVMSLNSLQGDVFLYKRIFLFTLRFRPCVILDPPKSISMSVGVPGGPKRDLLYPIRGAHKMFRFCSEIWEEL